MNYGNGRKAGIWLLVTLQSGAQIMSNLTGDLALKPRRLIQPSDARNPEP
jgi:hypothetical protein